MWSLLLFPYGFLSPVYTRTSSPLAFYTTPGIDNATMNDTRPSVARILVELDVTKRYTSQFWLGSESMGYIQTIEMEEFPSYCFHCKTLGHSKDVCPILFPMLGVIPPCQEELVADVPVNLDIVSGEVPQDDLGEHHDVNGAFENAVVVSQVVSRRLNVVGCVSLHAFELGDVVFQRDGGFISRTVVSKEVACVNLIELEDVGVDVMVLSHSDEVVVTEMVRVLGQPACPGSPGVMGTTTGVSISPVVVGSLYPENLIEVPISLMSDNDLNACAACNVGASCITSPAWCGGCPSPPSGMDDNIRNEQLDSLQDVYGIDVCKRAIDPLRTCTFTIINVVSSRAFISSLRCHFLPGFIVLVFFSALGAGMGDAANPWGVAASSASAKPQGFFNLGSETSKSPSRSFKEVVSGNTSSGDSIPSLAHSSMNGVPAIIFSDEEVLKLASPFQFTLVGKFTLRRPNLDAIRAFFNNLKLSGVFSVGLLDSRHVAIQLSNDLDYNQATAARTRPSVARILVEVDITKKHTKEIWIGSKACGYMQKVEFEKVPDFCNHCKMHGHSMAECFSLHPNLRSKASMPNERLETLPEQEPEIISKNLMVPPIVEGKEIEKDPLATTNNITEVNGDKVVTDGMDNIQDMVRYINEKAVEPNLYISVDSMLQNNSDINASPIHNAPPTMGAPNDHMEGGNMDDTEVEEGECISRAKSGRIENDQNSFCENDGFTKVGKKKSKNNKTVASSSRLTRTLTSSKDFNV
ncbi:hypothetical protein M5K25_017002 [Dendrobium thyrsiflorum]|uniref:DUF4283 domain-containing protein n=1 Tax=Dendrobium thyrsiflorum TaxID=117978 RepID=A0ABD0UT12_DENTH